MADGLVEQYAGPPGSEHYRHGAGGCRLGFQIHQCAPHRFAGILAGPILFLEVAVIVAAAATGACLLAASLVFDNDAYIETHQGAHIRREGAIAGDHHDAGVLAGETDVDLFHPRVQGAGEAVHGFQKGNALLLGQRCQRIDTGVQIPWLVSMPRLYRSAIAAVPGDCTGGSRRLGEGGQQDLIGVGEAGFLAADRSHADTLVDIEAAFLDDAVFQSPGFEARCLEVHVRQIQAPIHELPEGGLQLRFSKPARFEEIRRCDIQCRAQSAWKPKRM